MGYQTIEVRKSTPTSGPRSSGVDLSEPLGNQQFQEVHDALMENLVIFFRDQKLSPERHKEFGRASVSSTCTRRRPQRLAGIPRSSSSRLTRIPRTFPARIGTRM